ncbi:MAG: hypothetical protein ACR2GN_06565 [Bacteroidia bacterium]
MLRKLFLLFLFSILIFNAEAQTANQFAKAGDRALQREDFISAITYYTTALKKGADELEFGYKLAESHRQFHNYNDAEKWYRNTIQIDQENKYPLAKYHLALVLKNLMRYELAGNFLNAFLQDPGNADDYYKNKALVEIEAVKTAPELIKDTIPLSVERLSDRINSGFSEFAPFAENENKIYFSSIRYLTKKNISEGEKFYVSKILSSVKTSDWSRPRVLFGSINSDNENTSNAVINRQGDLMFFTRCNAGYPAEVKCKLFYSRLRGTRWQKPIELPANINLSNYTSTQPAIAESDDGNYIIYFASDRPGGIGKSDIWFTFMDKNDGFSEPVNAGNVINTPGEEVSPYYNDSTGILYFSSDYHIGIGGFDVFNSIGNQTNWTKPLNMGVPVNSSYNDLYFTLAVKSNLTGFLASNRPGSSTVTGEACCYDIYSFSEIIQPVKIDTADSLLHTQQSGIDSLNLNPETKAGLEYLKSFLPLELYFHNDEPDPRTLNIKTKKNYEETFTNYIKLKEVYRERYSENQEGNEALKADATIIRFFEEEVEEGMNKLNEFSDMLLQRLDAGDAFSLKLKAFTSPLASNEYNNNLAHRRISSLMNYFHDYREGAFQKYLSRSSDKSPQLILIEEPLGETTAPTNVSDELTDKRKSVYSPEAAAERRIEIIAVNVSQ